VFDARVLPGKAGSYSTLPAGDGALASKIRTSAPTAKPSGTWVGFTKEGSKSAVSVVRGMPDADYSFCCMCSYEHIYSIRVKFTFQVKLRPSSEHANALSRTLGAANAAANRLSQFACDSGEFNKFRLQRLFYHQIRGEFGLSAQVVVRLIAKVADAYKLDRRRQRVFRAGGSIAFDRRILSWNINAGLISISSVDGRLAIPFVCGQRQRRMLASQKGETDLVYRDGLWFLFATVDLPGAKEFEVLDWVGVDLGLVAIAHTSDGTRFAGGHLNGLRLRHNRLRRKLQKKGTRAARRLLRKRRVRERRLASGVNHKISKEIVAVAERTGRGISLEDLSGIRARIRARKAQRRRLHSWAFGQLQSFICYKAEQLGIPVRFVDPRNTSCRCPECDCVSRRNRRSQALFVCIRCGHRGNADAIAAENIRRAAVNQPDVAGVDVSRAYIMNRCARAKRNLVTSPCAFSRG
jgi:putative transposase